MGFCCFNPVSNSALSEFARCTRDRALMVELIAVVVVIPILSTAAGFAWAKLNGSSVEYDMAFDAERLQNHALGSVQVAPWGEDSRSEDAVVAGDQTVAPAATA